MSATIYDDRDPAFIYQGIWTAGTWNASSVDQSGTLHTTNDQNANITFTFPVAAIGFTVYGIQRSHGGSYGICIDCDFNAPNFVPVDGFNATDNGMNPPIALYNQTFSDLGVHEIIIRNQADPRGSPAGNSQLAFDRIELQINSGPATTTPASSTPTDPIPPPNDTTTSRSSSSPPVGAIVGGVLGGLAVFVSLVVILYWLRLRRRTRAHAHAYTAAAPGAPDDSMAQIRPPPSLQNSSSAMYEGSISSSGTPLYGAARAKAATASTQTHQPMPSMSSLATASSSQMFASNSSSSQPQPRREQDAGPLPAPMEDEEEEDDTLPPEYGQVFAQRRASRRNAETNAAAAVPGPRARVLPVPVPGPTPVTELSVDEKRRSQT